MPCDEPTVELPLCPWWRGQQGEQSIPEDSMDPSFECYVGISDLEKGDTDCHHCGIGCGQCQDDLGYLQLLWGDNLYGHTYMRPATNSGAYIDASNRVADLRAANNGSTPAVISRGLLFRDRIVFEQTPTYENHQLPGTVGGRACWQFPENHPCVAWRSHHQASSSICVGDPPLQIEGILNDAFFYKRRGWPLEVGGEVEPPGGSEFWCRKFTQLFPAEAPKHHMRQVEARPQHKWQTVMWANGLDAPCHANALIPCAARIPPSDACNRGCGPEFNCSTARFYSCEPGDEPPIGEPYVPMSDYGSFSRMHIPSSTIGIRVYPEMHPDIRRDRHFRSWVLRNLTVWQFPVDLFTLEHRGETIGGTVGLYTQEWSSSQQGLSDAFLVPIPELRGTTLWGGCEVRGSLAVTRVKIWAHVDLHIGKEYREAPSTLRSVYSVAPFVAAHVEVDLGIANARIVDCDASIDGEAITVGYADPGDRFPRATPDGNAILWEWDPQEPGTQAGPTRIPDSADWKGLLGYRSVPDSQAFRVSFDPTVHKCGDIALLLLERQTEIPALPGIPLGDRTAEGNVPAPDRAQISYTGSLRFVFNV